MYRLKLNEAVKYNLEMGFCRLPSLNTVNFKRKYFASNKHLYANLNDIHKYSVS